MTGYSLGFDIGSISVNTVVVDPHGQIVEEHYTRCEGRPFSTLAAVMEDVLSRYPAESIAGAATTGTGGELAGELIGGLFVNEIVAQSTSVSQLYPDARTVIEIGGEDSKLISITAGEVKRSSRLADFAMNTVCAAGTGSFLDQQAKRMGVSIEREFGELACRSADPPHIAGRCSVFAKSDMIHLQQIATPLEDIVAGLCFAVARNLRSNLARGREIERPVVFQGGVAANAGVVRAVREVFELSEDDLVVPRFHASMGAIGAVLYAQANPELAGTQFKGLEGLEEHLRRSDGNLVYWPQLKRPSFRLIKDVRFLPESQNGHDVYLGIDVGSLSTNVVLIDEEANVISRRYLQTAGKPLEAIRHGLTEIYEEVGDKVVVRGAGTTGSGRYLTGHFVGADTIKNEITAQATAAIHYHPEVDTVFEIGGQDSKYISIDNGVVVDFEMNKVCAAGTGSFLEEQAEKLGISIVDEFGEMALNAPHPCRLGDRCTVFMESDLNSHQQRGAQKKDLIGGLAYSIVQNYIQKVVGAKRIGDHILFQGGVTNNPSVVSAFGEITGKEIKVPPHFDVTGAIGVAMLARDEIRSSGRSTSFKGFEVSKTPYSMKRFTCKGCENHCDVHKVIIEGEERALFYGDRCDHYQPQGVRAEKERRRTEIPNLFDRREELLRGDYLEEPVSGEKTSIGIPRALMVYYQRFPFWRTFFEHLGFQVVLSRASDRPLVKRSLSMLVAETCFPVEVMHGHIRDLLDKGVDYLFTPFEVDYEAEENNPTINYNCPWIQCYPFMIRGALKGTEGPDRFLVPALHFRYSRKKLVRDLTGFMQEKFGTAAARTVSALEAAELAQRQFEQDVRETGRQVLAHLPANRRSLVILGRPYNTGDPELNLGLVEKLIDLDVLPIPLDFLPLETETDGLFRDYEMVCWPNGRKILAGARIIAKDDRLHAVFMTNFRCGPDSFLAHYVREEMRGKPHLQLEVDEHSADAGMITRCEAFLESLHGNQEVLPPAEETGAISRFTTTPSAGRTLYFPYMCDAAHMLAAASRACGIDAHVLPMQDETDLEWGRMWTSSRECFPMICTVGSFIKKLHEPGVDPARTSFFMPSHGGPCRFGQYQKLQRIILSNRGYSNVELVSPSNKNSYADYTSGSGGRFRLLVWKGMVACEILARLRQERVPYEVIPGETQATYERCLEAVEQSVEDGARDLVKVLRQAAAEFARIRMLDGPRKPVVAIVGEIFMRDNAFCSGHLRDRLERLGAETVMASVREWLELSSFNYRKVSKWEHQVVNSAKARIQLYFQDHVTHKLEGAMSDLVESERSVAVEEILEHCAAYIHTDYSGEPPMALGAAGKLAGTGISGVASIMPFTCLPGTVIASLANAFRSDHDDIPWVTVAFDGQEDTAIETRLQAFVHQAREFAREKGYDRAPRVQAATVAAGGVG
jgi:predicted CoA-substrate-specific enzyme activase